MKSVARITGTGTVSIAGTVVATDGLIRSNYVLLHEVTVSGTGGAGTTHLHDTDSGTGTGTIAVLVTAGTLPAPYPFGGAQTSHGLRVVQSGTTGGLQTIVVYE